MGFPALRSFKYTPADTESQIWQRESSSRYGIPDAKPNTAKWRYFNT
jgi:uncharacterized protein YfaA (DUF2138 family)